MPSNVVLGKAFEYACLQTIEDAALAAGTYPVTRANASYTNARAAYYAVDPSEQARLITASKVGLQLLEPLEPRLFGGSGRLLLELATDHMAVGADGDVRDVICTRDEMHPEWTIGLSCKHNHSALRHPRITESMDFGRDWVRTPCGQDFLEVMTPITQSLVTYGRSGVEWNQIPNKSDDYYVPILQAYRDEIRRMCSADPDMPAKLLRYFFGALDFYKIIMQASSRTTTIEAFNMNDTLNASLPGKRALIKVPVTKLPTRLYNIDLKRGSKTTIELTFDGGWAVSMRLHNKDRIAKPTSLAWDVNLIGLPTGMYINKLPW